QQACQPQPASAGAPGPQGGVTVSSPSEASSPPPSAMPPAQSEAFEFPQEFGPNFETESFGGYNPSVGEDPEEFVSGGLGRGTRGSGGWGRGGWGPGGWGYGGSRFWRSRWPYYRRWPWLSGGGFGLGDLAPNTQSIAWAQGCLSQITGSMI